MQMQLDGSLQGKRYHLQLNGDTVDDLLDRAEDWQFTLAGEVFDRQIDASGSKAVKDDEPEVGLTLTVKDAAIGTILERLGLVEGLETLDPNTPEYVLDLVSFVEAILENPRIILLRQTDRG